MDWANERYVRLYTRDTATWKLLDWRARSVLLHLIRKVDRAGVLDVGDDGVFGLAAVLELPIELVEPAVEQLTQTRTKDGRPTVIAAPHAYVLPNFLEAQETPQSDPQRKRESRGKRRDLAMRSRIVTTASRNVTDAGGFVTDAEEDESGDAGRNVPEPGRNVTDANGYHPSRNVTDAGGFVPGPSRNVAEPGRAVTSGHSYPRPDQTRPRENESSRARAIPPSTEHGVRGRDELRRKLWGDSWNFAGKAYQEAKTKGVDPHAQNCWSGVPASNSPEGAALFEIIDLLAPGDSAAEFDRARDVIRNRVLVAIAEAEHKHKHLQFCTPMRMWNADSFAIAKDLTPEQVTQRRGPSANGIGTDPSPNRIKKLG